MNLIAYSYGLENIKKDDEICISIMEHHSNLVPWQKVVKTKQAKLNYMYINNTFSLDLQLLADYNPRRKNSIHL